MASLVELDTPDAARRGLFRRVLGLRAAVPAPLAAILAVVVVVGVSWALIVPPFQSPDETAHFAYAQSLAERFAFPGTAGRLGFSDDQNLADKDTLATQRAFHSGQLKADWSTGGFDSYLDADRADPSRSNGGGPNPASSNPPLYYLYSDLAYWASYGGNAFDRLYAMRLWGVCLLALTALGAWLLAGEVFGRRRLAQLSCATVVGLFPMVTFMSTNVNPDALLITLWTFALWLAARLVKRGLKLGDTLALFAVTAAAILTKSTAYALVPPVLVAVVLGGWDIRRRTSRIPGRTIAAALLVPVAIVIGWIVLSSALGRPVINRILSPSGISAHPFVVRQFVSYVWQFYLPRLSWMTPLRSTAGLPLYDIWLREGWGLFGWLEIEMSNWLYALLTGITALIAIVAAAIVVRFRDSLRLKLLAMLAVAFVSLVFGLHLTDYRSIIAGAGPILQGRYLLPLIALFGLAVALIVTRVPSRWRGCACAGLAAAMLLLQVLALSTIVQAYYT